MRKYICDNQKCHKEYEWKVVSHLEREICIDKIIRENSYIYWDFCSNSCLIEWANSFIDGEEEE